MTEDEIGLEALSTTEHGYIVDDEDDDDPVLLDRTGRHVDTWRERYPYDERMARGDYEHPCCGTDGMSWPAISATVSGALLQSG
jgi:hypothetical protein